jgi:para-nitrobenzyl esterase
LKTIGELIATDNVDLFGDDHTGFTMAFQPVFGGDVLPRFPIEALRDGSGAGIPTLVGTTREEWKLFTLALRRDAKLVREPRPLRNLCARAGRSAEELVDNYERKLKQPSDVDLRELVETDHLFRIPAIRLAEAQVANDTPTWMYRFDWRSSAFDGRFGACHALEIPFVFDNLDAPGVDIFTGGAGPQSLAAQMHAAWVAFAKAGDPNTPELPTWPRYDATSRATMLLDVDPTVANDPDGDLRAAWDGLL